MLCAKKSFGPPYAFLDDATFLPKYRATCFCGRVRYEVSAEPVDAKLCHCRGCQKLHGAPMQWAAIFHKHHVRFTAGLELLRFYNSEQDVHERILPCKVSCSQCGSLIADEGRRMWLAFPALFDFKPGGKIPDSFKPTCHLFYGQRVIDVGDTLPKWSGHKNESTRL